jgi:glycosyltransferase involved in cell wall biosynthesis
MKVLFQSRKTLFDAPGGDTIQLLKTKEYLEKLGVTIDITQDLEPDLSGYDLVHIFNLMRGQETYIQVKNAKKYGVKIALSTIYGLYTDFERNARGGFAQKIFNYLNPFQIEWVKIAARTFIGGELHKGSLWLLYQGYKNTLQKIVKDVDVFLPNSQSEMNRVISDFTLLNPTYEVIPNAVDKKLFSETAVVIPSDIEKYKDAILCVSRIEGRKCQLDIVRALKDTNYKILFIGKPGKNHQSYYEQVKNESNDNVFFISHITQEELLKYYQICKVHLLVSWMETPGLSSLEAAAMGKNIVITPNGDTRDYFEDLAFYCVPGDLDSIKDAVEKAFNVAVDPRLKERILNEYIWEKTAECTLKGYQKALLKTFFSDN